jgi:WD40 repeat protein
MAENVALVIGVGRFSATCAPDEEVTLGSGEWRPLDFVYDVLPQVAGSFRDLGYRTVEEVDPDETALRRAVAQSLDDGCRIVHVISHGATNRDGDPARVDVVPSSGRIGAGTNVSEWVSTAQTLRHPTLFLLDLCGSGRAARLPFLLQHAGRVTYAWVVAASGADEDAYDGRFSQAVSEVLTELSRTGLGADITRRHVAFSVVARHIRRQVELMPGIPQTVFATAMDLGLDEPDLPFFPNPRFREDALRSASHGIESPLRAFLDDLLTLQPGDAEHFADRAGHHFVGRRRQLRSLAPWLDDDTAGGVRVVTGSPGSGKSALLGALVCAAHPELVAVIPQVRARLQAQDARGCPSRHAVLAAIHARARRLDDIVVSVARQLALSTPKDGWRPASLVRAVASLATPPPIVLDALDEATDPDAVTAELLLPLARAIRPDGRPVCRLLVGMRPWQRFARLREFAEAEQGLIDLDAVDPSELRTDLADHFTSSLADFGNYTGRTQRAVREQLATTIATTLVPEDARRPEWGAFLVGSVFTRYLLSTPPVHDLADATRLGSSVPTTLPDVLELDLGAGPRPVEVRAVLAAIAQAKGDGMPAELVSRLCVALVPELDGGRIQQLVDHDARFYLRTSTEADGTTLYRVFHQGLTDHLRSTAIPGRIAAPDPGFVLDQLLAEYGRHPGASRRGASWSAAPAYLLRHAIEHAADAGRLDELATDPEFLVHADPDILLQTLDRADTDRARLTAVVYRTSLALHRPADPSARLTLLSIDAARHRDSQLLAGLVSITPPGHWRPLWTTNPQVHKDLRQVLIHPGLIALSCVAAGECALAITVSAQLLRTWDVRTGRLLNEVTVSLSSVATANAVTVDDRVMLIVGRYDNQFEVYDVATGCRRFDSLTHPGSVVAVAFTEIDGRPVALTGCTVDGVVRVWGLDTGTLVGTFDTGEREIGRLACMTLDGRVVVVVGSGRYESAGSLRLWDLISGRPLGEPTGWYVDGVTELACTVVDGRPVAVAAGTNTQVQVWYLDTSKRKGESTEIGWATALACATWQGGHDIVACTKGGVEVWDLDTMMPVGALPSGSLISERMLGYVAVEDRLLAVVGTDDAAQIRDLTNIDINGDAVFDDFGFDRTLQVEAVAHTTLDDTACVVTSSHNETDNVTLSVRDAWTGRLQHQLEYAPERGQILVRQLVCTDIDRRPVVLAGDGHRIAAWDIAAGSCSEVMPSERQFHPTGLVCVPVEGRPTAVTVDTTTTPVETKPLMGFLRVWDPATGQQLRPALRLREAPLAVAHTELDGRQVAIVATNSSTISYQGNSTLWSYDIATGRMRERVPGLGPVTALACVDVMGRPAAVTVTGYDGTIEAWDLATGRRLAGPVPGDAHGLMEPMFCCTTVAGEPVAAWLSGSNHDTVGLWNLRSGRLERIRMPGRMGAISLGADGNLIVGLDQEVIALARMEDPR